MDRTTCGLIAGIIAGAAMNVWNLFDYYVLHLTEIRFLDWSAVLLSWTTPANNLQAVTALILQVVVWDGFLGIMFAHLIVLITSKSIIYKSTLYGILLWFCFKVIVNLYRVPVLSGLQPFPGAISNMMGTALWGIVLGLVLKKYEAKF